MERWWPADCAACTQRLSPAHVVALIYFHPYQVEMQLVLVVVQTAGRYQMDRSLWEFERSISRGRRGSLASCRRMAFWWAVS
jgi:hypothetical protein